MSHLAMPILCQKRLVGVLLVESRNRMAFGHAAEVLAEAMARLAGVAIACSEVGATVEPPVAQTAPVSPPKAQPDERSARRKLRPTKAQTVKVVQHAFDDSVFIGDSYVIKGVAGRLLMLILELHLKERRVDFTNRELRWHDATRLPDFKDNLETRLLVLRRRLDEKQVPLRLARVGRGQLRLDLQGFPAIPHV